MNHIDLVLFLALVAFGWYVLACRPWGIGHDQAAAAGLAGALFGGAALLLDNWINRVNDRLKAAQEQADQVEKLKAIGDAEPELVTAILKRTAKPPADPVQPPG